MKYLKKLIKNIIISIITIYSLNIFLTNLNVYIPINIFSILISGFLGFPGLLMLILIIYKFYW